MNPEYLTTQMARNAERVRLLALGISDEQARWKPDANSWSILEVVNHLCDEEREDFRVRLDHILHHPGKTWPSIDPQGWVTARRYNERDLDESVKNFVLARQESLDWLQSLGTPDWERAVETPWGGTIRAGDMFAAWTAHDTLHLRQLVELHHAYVVYLTQPYAPDYAGDW
jgi:hypothetical protein